MLALAIGVILLMTALIGTLTGWVAHWVSHQPWSGPLFMKHMTHHRLYSAVDLVSDRYRSAKHDNSAFIFTPVIVTVLAIWVGILAYIGCGWLCCSLVVALAALVGVLHDWVHSTFHIRNHWLVRRSRYLQRLQGIHWQHHRKVRVNFGILWFGWDRVLRTYRKAEPPKS